jgi:hypothetical protein
MCTGQQGRCRSATDKLSASHEFPLHTWLFEGHTRPWTPALSRQAPEVVSYDLVIGGVVERSRLGSKPYQRPCGHAASPFAVGLEDTPHPAPEIALYPEGLGDLNSSQPLARLSPEGEK